MEWAALTPSPESRRAAGSFARFEAPVLELSGEGVSAALASAPRVAPDPIHYHAAPVAIYLDSLRGRGAAREARENYPLRPAGGRGAGLRRMDRGRLFPSRGGGDAGGELLGCDPAAERDRRPAHGPRAERLDAGRAGADEPDARSQRALGPRHRPRRDRHPGGGRERAAGGGQEPPGAGPRGVRQAGLGVERGVRLADRRAVQAARRLLRLRARALHPRRGLRQGRLPRLQAALRQGLHLPRQLHGQLGPGLALGDLRPRGREPRGRGHALLDRLPGRGLRPGAHRGDGAAGDDARRHRGRGQSGRRALRRPGRRALRAAAGRAAAADHRRRARRPRVRHRRPEDHPRARPQRLRDRPQARARGDRRDRPRRPPHRGGRRVRRDERRRGAGGRGRGAARGGPPARRGALRPLGPVLPPLRRADRAADLAAVVLPHGRAGEAGDRGRRTRRGADRAGAVEARLPRLDAGDPPLVHLAPALVGTPDPGLVLRSLRGDDRRRAPARALRRLRRRAAPGGGRARHLVQLGALALRHPRLARARRRSCAPSTRPASSPPPARSSSSGWRG